MVTRRQFLKATGVLGAGLLVATRPGRVVQAQGPLPPIPKRPQPSKRITSAQRKLAAERAKAAGLQPGLAVGQKAAMDPGGIPHYFGPYANYANSPVPTGGIADITVNNGGSGYTVPTVTITDVYGTGANAAATAVVAEWRHHRHHD